MKKITAQIILAVMVSMSVYAQSRTNPKANISKPHWLRFSIIFLEGCQPRIFPDNIIFTKGECRANAHAGKIFQRGTKVKVYSAVKDKGFFKVRFRYWPEMYELESEYEVLVSEKGFRKSFDLLFSEREVPNEYDCSGDVETKKQVIQCLGFPISITKDGDAEQYFYILEFVGPNPFSEYDGFNIRIKKGKVIEVSGYV